MKFDKFPALALYEFPNYDNTGTTRLVVVVTEETEHHRKGVLVSSTSPTWKTGYEFAWENKSSCWKPFEGTLTEADPLSSVFITPIEDFDATDLTDAGTEDEEVQDHELEWIEDFHGEEVLIDNIPYVSKYYADEALPNVIITVAHGTDVCVTAQAGLRVAVDAVEVTEK